MQTNPTLTPMAREIARHAGWTIFETFEHEDRHDFMAVHDDTGETRDVDVTGYRRPDDVDLYRLAVLGFPRRLDEAPLTSAQIAAMFEAAYQRRETA